VVVEEGTEGAGSAGKKPRIGDKITLWCEESNHKNARLSLYHATVTKGNGKNWITVQYRQDNFTQPLDRDQYVDRLYEKEWVNLLEHLEGPQDVAAQCIIIQYEAGNTSISKKGRAVADWYNFVFARENLQRALVDDHENKMFRYHELNPPSDLVVIEPPPPNDGTFRGLFMQALKDDRLMALHLKRDDRRSRYQSEVSPLASALLKCNTLMSPMLTLTSAKAAMHYLSKYFQKNSMKPKDSLVLYHKCLQLLKKYPSRAADSTWDPERRRGKNLITKICNKKHGAQEFTSTQVAMCLLGFDSRNCSHGTYFAF
jgi:hypothetical protein